MARLYRTSWWMRERLSSCRGWSGRREPVRAGVIRAKRRSARPRNATSRSREVVPVSFRRLPRRVGSHVHPWWGRGRLSLRTTRLPSATPASGLVKSISLFNLTRAWGTIPPTATPTCATISTDNRSRGALQPPARGAPLLTARCADHPCQVIGLRRSFGRSRAHDELLALADEPSTCPSGWLRHPRGYTGAARGLMHSPALTPSICGG